MADVTGLDVTVLQDTVDVLNRSLVRLIGRGMPEQDVEVEETIIALQAVLDSQ